eukprot:gene20706-27512_t
MRQAKSLLPPEERESVQQLIGGANPKRQHQDLKKNRPAIVVGTPGRLLDMMLNRGPLKVGRCPVLILDEVVVSASLTPILMGKLSLWCPSAKLISGNQSSTSSGNVLHPSREATGSNCKSAQTHSSSSASEVSNSEESTALSQTLPPNLQHYYLIVPSEHKTDRLRRCIHALGAQRALVFVNLQRHVMETLYKLTARNLEVTVLHGKLSKLERGNIIDAFRRGTFRVMIVTDMAARGLDVPGCQAVINMGVPADEIKYTHRGTFRVMAVTDMAARGLDVPGCQAVINMGVPADEIKYAHRGTFRVMAVTDMAARGLDVPGCQAVINMGVPADEIKYAHSIISAFRMGTFRVMVVTDMAAFGLDVLGCIAVINMGVPADEIKYAHRWPAAMAFGDFLQMSEPQDSDLPQDDLPQDDYEAEMVSDTDSAATTSNYGYVYGGDRASSNLSTTMTVRDTDSSGNTSNHGYVYGGDRVSSNLSTTMTARDTDSSGNTSDHGYVYGGDRVSSNMSTTMTVRDTDSSGNTSNHGYVYGGDRVSSNMSTTMTVRDTDSAATTSDHGYVYGGDRASSNMSTTMTASNTDSSTTTSNHGYVYGGDRVSSNMSTTMTVRDTDSSGNTSNHGYVYGGDRVSSNMSTTMTVRDTDSAATTSNHGYVYGGDRASSNMSTTMTASDTDSSTTTSNHGNVYGGDRSASVWGERELARASPELAVRITSRGTSRHVLITGLLPLLCKPSIPQHRYHDDWGSMGIEPIGAFDRLHLIEPGRCPSRCSGEVAIQTISLAELKRLKRSVFQHGLAAVVDFIEEPAQADRLEATHSIHSTGNPKPYSGAMASLMDYVLNKDLNQDLMIKTKEDGSVRSTLITAPRPLAAWPSPLLTPFIPTALPLSSPLMPRGALSQNSAATGSRVELMSMRQSTSAVALLFAFVSLACVRATEFLEPVEIGAGWKRYEMVVKVAYGAPDCFERPVIMVNDLFSPGINATVGDMLYYAGTYICHDLPFAIKADGLQGPLIIMPAENEPEPFEYDAEYVMYISDWYHTPANWAGNPQGMLINGHGYYGDCPLAPGFGGGPVPQCNASIFTVGKGRSAVQPWASDTNPGCTHTSYSVKEGMSYRFRLIAGTTLVYTTVCFENHEVSVIALDGLPVEPFLTKCVDLNNGQRVDVILDTKISDMGAKNFWISVNAQERHQQQFNQRYFICLQIKIKEELTSLQPRSSPWAQYQKPYGFPMPLVPPEEANRMFRADVSQPLFNATGILRWAINNVMNPASPSCAAKRHEIQKDPHYLQKMQPGLNYGTGQKSLNISKDLGGGSFISTAYNKEAELLLDWSFLGPLCLLLFSFQGWLVRLGEMACPVRIKDVSKDMPEYPTIGMAFAMIQSGDTVEVVIQNNPADSFNGDYRGVRTAMEQHPIHLHGHRFWVLGHGSGVWDPENETMVGALNLEDPPYRDSVTLFKDGYVVIRFVAENPGIWPFHCHILWHHIMGQGFNFVESVDKWTKQPKGFPKCPKKCLYNTNPFTKDWVDSRNTPRIRDPPGHGWRWRSLGTSRWPSPESSSVFLYYCICRPLRLFASMTTVKPFVCTMPMRLDDGWNQIQFNLSDFTRRAYGPPTSYSKKLLETFWRVQCTQTARIPALYFSDFSSATRLYSEEELPSEYKLFLPLYDRCGKWVKKHEGVLTAELRWKENKKAADGNSVVFCPRILSNTNG